MRELGVAFSTAPTKTPGPTVAVFDDTCGNLIQLYQDGRTLHQLERAHQARGN